MANIEKKRARKFTQDDVELLTELVFRYKHNNQPSTSRGVRNKHEEAYNEFIRLGGDPAMLGDDTPAYPDFTESGNTPPHSLEDIGSSNNTPAPVDMPPSVGLPTPATPPAPASEARPTPVGPNTIRNNKRQRINFNTLREYVGELGDLKKRKYELQNKLLELQIQKLQQELNTSQE
ncbi:hypothetical protein RP20_CCG018037 [Aedes albopictus]|nr:hypothetical protein RP20_CCG018037 [Aedes albopictus]